MQIEMTYAKFLALKAVTPRISNKLIYTIKTAKIDKIFPFASVGSGVSFLITNATAPSEAAFLVQFPTAILAEGFIG